MAGPGLEIRPYRASDRRRVREICHLTGYMGEPADWLWRDRESFADVFSGYYTDREPGSALVAADERRAFGFLLGCRDSSRVTPPGEIMKRAVLRRALPLRPGTAGFFWRSLADLLRERDVPDGELDDPRWPAHLHIDLLPEARGCGLGGALMRRWLERLRSEGCPGCHLGTFHENTRAIGFFERMGFRRHGTPRRVPGFRLREGGRMHVQWMVQSLEPGADAPR